MYIHILSSSLVLYLPSFQPLALQLFSTLFCVMFLCKKRLYERLALSAFLPFFHAIFLPSFITARRIPPLSSRTIADTTSVCRPHSTNKYLVSLHFSFNQYMQMYIYYSKIFLSDHSWQNNPVLCQLPIYILSYY